MAIRLQGKFCEGFGEKEHFSEGYENSKVLRQRRSVYIEWNGSN